MGYLDERLERAQRHAVVGEQARVEGTSQRLVGVGQPLPGVFLVLGEEGAHDSAGFLWTGPARGTGVHARPATGCLRAIPATSDAASEMAAASRKASCRPPSWAA